MKALSKRTTGAAGGRQKILVSARSFWSVDGPHQTRLRQGGYDLMRNPHDRLLQAAELIPLVSEVVAVILGLDVFSAEVIARAPLLRVISRYGTGIDNVDLAAATERGIVVAHTPGANSTAVAELAIGLMLALVRAIPAHDRNVRAGRWDRLTGVELRGQTLGLIGFGRIGREVARRARAFGMRIVYHDPVEPPAEVADELGASASDLDGLLTTSDVISLHLPLTPESRHLIDDRALRRMRPTAFLVNTARGGLVDEGDLARALTEGWIAGAAADVFEREPPRESPLLARENFIASPHAGGATRQAAVRMGLEAAENALAVLRGERPAHVANPEVYAHPRWATTGTRQEITP